MATWLDKLITFGSAPELLPIVEGQDANERQILANWERILANPNLTAEQRLVAERELAKFKGTTHIGDIAEGNTKVFANEAIAQGKAAVAGATSFVSESFFAGIPIGLLVTGLVALVLWFKFGGKQ